MGVAASAAMNIYQGVAVNLTVFALVLVGFLIFLVTKIIVISKGELVSFTPSLCQTWLLGFTGSVTGLWL